PRPPGSVRPGGVPPQRGEKEPLGQRRQFLPHLDCPPARRSGAGNLSGGGRGGRRIRPALERAARARGDGVGGRPLSPSARYRSIYCADAGRGPRGERPSGTKGVRPMDPKSTAGVLIEYQNDFTSDGGTLHGAVKTVMDKTNMLANTVETVKKARELGATIVYAPITFTDDYHELSPTPYGILKGVVDSKSFRQGGQTGPRRLRHHQPRFHPAQPRHLDHRARRIPDQLLRRIDDADRIREGLRRHHAQRLHRDRQRGRAEGRRREELPDVLEADEPRRVPVGPR